MNGSVKLPEVRARGLLSRVEEVLFGHRRLVLASLAVFTLVMAWFAVQLRMDAGFEKQLPIGHEYIKTFEAYRNDLQGANRLTLVVRARHGSIWSAPGLKRVYDVTQALTFLPGVSRSSVRSLWTPNAFVNEITEEGFRADPLVPGTVTAEHLDDEIIAKIASSSAQGGFIGTLVSRDQSSAMITAELNEFDANGARLDYVAFNHALEKELRQQFEDGDFEIQMIGFAKQIGDIADGASAVLEFCLLALLLTAAAVYWYCHSLRFTLLALVCSLASLVWQFGSLRLLGYGLDPLAVLVPFLVFAIGVSHGVQQINFIVREIALGKSAEEAARSSFTGLLVPGTLALVTALVSFVTLLLIPIPMVRELAITASLGVAFKIITNLVMLPLVASLLRVDDKYASAQEIARQRRTRWLHGLSRLAERRNAQWVLGIALMIFLAAIWQSHDRVVGTLQAGAPELREDSRFNRDAVSIASNYDIGLDWLSVVFEVNRGDSAGDSQAACEEVAVGQYQDRFVWAMQEVPGVLSVASFSSNLRQFNEGYNEGNPKMGAVPIDPVNYAALATEVARTPGLMRTDCSMSAVHLYLADHKATTINRVIEAAKAFRSQYPMPGVVVRLASGNAGVLAAINEEVEKSETPMLLYVYAAIALLVFVVYRDWRAVLVCCLPLTIGTFIGYWFMKELQIGLTIATLPVMVLAVGIGVDYAFYIYNRLQLHQAHGQPITKAVEHALLEVGIATIFTAITLAIGVATWAFSELKFQADMGKLLAFMFIVNMVMAMTVLPAFAVWLEWLFPRRRPVRMIGALVH
ncbi:RND family transporter [Pseudomonas sp. TKO26]|uniref:efflux RND transporter permease subunit n=1 Tax=unclassified Pseudomonas TaxID=196821 RepID=UPI000D95A6FC|nr:MULTISPECIES: efflux RND transporter permease subunit [unclassified Pseudomonas]PYY81949.1 RND family transporter [Pseudomonas sp. TKO30]PYY83472.1 RND family transporter [Pseudomonas sp. TKO29]PYY85216.1 RND family transporter [Pseudomonas sp. TKO26]PYY97865.1 RND family transporter [Pseudomonas sp. TKO14]